MSAWPAALVQGVDEAAGVSVDEFVVPRVLLAIAVIVVVARLMGRLFARFGQPAVVGEIVGGILLGPTFLGLFPGALDTQLFPTEIRDALTVVANLGLVIFMFIVGLELDFALIKGKGRTAGTISVSSIILPFALGVVLALGLHGAHDIVVDAAGQALEVEVLPFALFIGASMSVTAFPVLARILVDRGMIRVPLGVLALSSAAVDDVLAWSLLAAVIAVVDSTGVWDLPIIVGQSAVFIAVMFVVVRPLLGRVIDQYRRIGRLTPGILAVFVAGALVSSFVTAEIGIHQIFGAFLFGAAIPRRGSEQLFHDIRERLEHVSVLLLLPVFFVATGLNVDATGLGISGLATLAAVIGVACAGKFIGATVGARATGVPIRKAAAVGVLMNTRGLTELVILGVGLEKHILDPQLFTALVIMAVFTTVITEPVLRRLYTDRMLTSDLVEAERSASTSRAAYRVLVHLDDLDRAGPTVDAAVSLAGDERPAEIILSHLPPPVRCSELGGGLHDHLASTAESLDALNVLRERVQRHDLDCVVVARTSVDPLADVVEQAAGFGADLVLIDVDADVSAVVEVGRFLNDVASDVAIVIRGSTPYHDDHPAVAAVLGGHVHDAAALEVAARVTLGLGTELELTDREGGHRATRRAATARAELEPLGLTVDVSTALQRDPPAHGARWQLLVAGFEENWQPIASAGSSSRDADERVASYLARAATLVVVRSRQTYERVGLQRMARSRAATTPHTEPISA